MLNELVKVANAMKKADIVTVDWHPKLKVLPKVKKNEPCLRIWLTEGGHIKDLESLNAEHVAKLRKYEPDNGKSLPGFNVRPLYRQIRSDEEMKGKKFEKELLSRLAKEDLDLTLYRQEKDDFWEKTRDGLSDCFGRVLKQLQKVSQNSLDDGETLFKLFSAIEQIDIHTFQGEYEEVLAAKIKEGTLPLSLMCYFLTEEKKKKEDDNSRTPVPKFSVFLDVVNYKGYPVAHEKTISRLNSFLMVASGKSVPSSDKIIENDAYGFDRSGIKEKFPGVALSSLGSVILRSQAKSIPAQKRYHQCESNTFPVGLKMRKRTKAALEWIASPERAGETYGLAGDQELLFAYPDVLPKDKIPLAKMFGVQSNQGFAEDQFELIAKSVIKQLTGLGASIIDSELEIFSLRKMNKAQTKVVYYHNTTVAFLEKSSKKWHNGCQNISQLDVWDWSEEKSEKTGKKYPNLIENTTVFPVKLHRYLNAVWKRDGGQAGKTKIFEPADGLKLLLNESCDALAAYMIERFMQHAQGYFIFMCRATGRREIAKLPDKKYYPGILGLLLLKLGKERGEYMKESAFLLGRFLRIADEIHRLYCEVVRKNEFPSELCGSSMLVGMMESPARTMDQLAMRSAPYVKWARAYHGDKGGIIHYWMNHWSLIAEQLHEMELPKRLKPEERAQVFLGYLASFQKNEKQINSDNFEEDNNE